MLSGGGANGAFTAGVLQGWTFHGSRPQFDVVTGISAGALVAPFAFLGSEYDHTLERAATDLRERDVYQRRALPALLWADSLADSAPLRQRIAAEITPELLTKIAKAHVKGRRLYVGTTDLDTKRLVVWDLGAVAAGSASDKLELFRNVLLASASVPGVFPPVPINLKVDDRQYSELHVDGAVSASLFLESAMLRCDAIRDTRVTESEDVNVYVIVAQKLQPPPRPVARRLFPVAEESFGGVLQSRLEGDLLKVYMLTRLTGARLALTAVPDDWPDDPDPLRFDPKAMRKLFGCGYRAGVEGVAWRSLPPALEQELQPRSGTVFTMDKQAPRPAYRQSDDVLRSRLNNSEAHRVRR